MSTTPPGSSGLNSDEIMRSNSAVICVLDCPKADSNLNEKLKKKIKKAVLIFSCSDFLIYLNFDNLICLMCRITTINLQAGDDVLTADTLLDVQDFIGRGIGFEIGNVQQVSLDAA